MPATRRDGPERDGRGAVPGRGCCPLDDRPRHLLAGGLLRGLQCVRRGGRGRGPVCGHLGHQVLDDPGHRIGHPVGHRLVRRAGDGGQQVGARERGRAAEQREQGGAEAVEVGGGRCRSGQQPLGSGVGGARAHLPVRGALGDAREPRDSEVAQLGLAEPGDEDVRRLDVEVQNARSVRGLQRPGHRHAHLQHLGPRQGAVAAEAVGERPPGQEVHDDVRLTRRRGAAAVHGDDVRVPREGAHRAAPAGERPPHALAVDPLGQDLDRHPAPELRLPRRVHGAEPAPADHLGVDDARDAEVIGRDGMHRRSVDRRGRGKSRADR